ncbi:hypothetical protein P5673_023915, partial [Acropora cervicornis]
MKRTVDKLNLDTCCSQRVSLGNESSTGIHHPLPPIGGAPEVCGHFHANNLNSFALEVVLFDKLFTCQDCGSTSIRCGAENFILNDD